MKDIKHIASDRSHNTLCYAFWIITFSVLVIFLQTRHAFHFYCLEQNQLFQNTRHYIIENLFQPGGLALVISEFLVQFFLLPYMGAIISALLICIAGLFTSLILNRISTKTNVGVLGAIPALMLLFIMFDFNYLTYGTVAFIFAVITLWGALSINDFRKRLIVHFIMTFILFFIAGPVYVLYALSATLYELISKSAGNYLALFILLEAVLIAIGSVYFLLYPQYHFAILPDAYYHYRKEPNIHLYFSWISFILVILTALLVRKVEVNTKKQYILLGAQTILVVILCIWGIPRYDDSKSYRVKELDYYCRTEQWDKILERCKGKLTNYLYMCYANMALMEKGMLGENVFSYDQKGPQGILVGWNMTAPISVLLSDVYFAVNNTGMSQKMAFEAYIGTATASNPRILKRLVQTNLIFGCYPVAEKYIKILENTRCYKTWAKEHRKYLYNDNIVEADPVLGIRRKSLAHDNFLSLAEGLDQDLIRMAEYNPSYKSTIEFVGAYYLLAKEMQHFGNLIHKYYGTEVLPMLPKSFQEAIITLFEKDPEKWKEYNISDHTIKRFQEFKKQILANKKNPDILPGLLNNAYGDTFWFYFMFK